MTLENIINPAHYDGLMHKVPFEVGADFGKKWQAYRDDGFSVSLAGNGYFLAFKGLPGDPIPEMAEE